ncbi:MAG: NYN domain-containing protein [Hydrogenophaga sp.]|nr:NYN domain-containing protein [Hydrogenophaga sp.]
MREEEKKIALLIDADNMPAEKVEDILSELSKYGLINIRRAYGNWKKPNLSAWEDRLHEFAIRPMQQFDLTKGKNASDMALTIDALDLLYSDRPDAFAIVSSDSDFTPLVMHVRAKGAAVYGFGRKHTPIPFQRACTQFLMVENLGEAADEPPPSAPASLNTPQSESKDDSSAIEPIPTNKLRQDTRLVKLLRGAVDSSAAEDGWAQLGVVGKHISNQVPFDARNYGYPKLVALIEATQLFEVKRHQLSVFVRDKRWAKLQPTLTVMV